MPRARKLQKQAHITWFLSPQRQILKCHLIYYLKPNYRHATAEKCRDIEPLFIFLQ